tara:strand:+ start:357 stop:1676 length:1320 start_codon:yes stop_codon:yes gene_type:complete
MRISINETKLFKKLIEQIYNVKINILPRGITIDSRLHESGDVYLPIVGENFDGHEFISSVVENNPSLIFSEKELKLNTLTIKTDNNRQTIHKIVKAWRKKIKPKIIGITGSNGKTTTKELAYHVLSKSIDCFKTDKNFNTVLSSPLSFLSAKQSQKVALIEMGTNQPGEINSICEIYNPDIGLITNISNAHIGNFRSNQEIAIEKGRLFNSLPKDGFAIINNDDNYIPTIKTNAKKITYGFNGSTDFKGNIIDSVNITVNKQKIKLPVSGFAMAQNALAIFTLSSILGIKNNEIAEFISSFNLPKGRGQILKIQNIEIIDDSYNANPVSMIDGLRRLTKIKAKRKIAILGDMFELGKTELESHEKIGKFLSSSNLELILTIGSRMKYAHKIVKDIKTAYWFKSKEEIIDFIKKIKKKGDLIYIKGSRGMAMEKIIEGLK